MKTPNYMDAKSNGFTVFLRSMYSAPNNCSNAAKQHWKQYTNQISGKMNKMTNKTVIIQCRRSLKCNSERDLIASIRVTVCSHVHRRMHGCICRQYKRQ